MELTPKPHRLVDPSKADWELRFQSEWNASQRRAAATHGWDTIGNRITAAGLLLSLGGVSCIASGDHLVAGTVLIVAGRGCDLLDGYCADKRGVKSPLGGKLDAGSDTLIMLTAMAALTMQHILSVEEVSALAAIMATKIAGTGVGMARGLQQQTTDTGKYTTAVLWAGVETRLAATILSQHSGGGEALVTASNVLMDLGIVGTAAAGCQYMYRGCFGNNSAKADEVLPALADNGSNTTKS